MCGIIGFSILEDRYRYISGNRFLQTVLSLQHRGPDAWGAVGIREDGLFEKTITRENIYRLGLGHTRLAILDLSNDGRQPFTDRKGNWLVYNGEIYNYLELKYELQQKGRRSPVFE